LYDEYDNKSYKPMKRNDDGVIKPVTLIIPEEKSNHCKATCDAKW